MIRGQRHHATMHAWPGRRCSGFDTVRRWAGAFVLFAVSTLFGAPGIAGCDRSSAGTADSNGAQQSAAPDNALTLYCAAGMKPPVEAVAHQYETEYGTTIQLQYGGSGTLLSNIQIARSGDMYLAADDSYIAQAREKGLVAESVPLARLRLVIAVRKGNPKNIQNINDLLFPDLSVGLANPDQAAVGRATRAALRKTGHWEKLEAHARVFKPTVNDVANDIKIGAIDAAVIWDATAAQYPEIDAVAVDAFAAEMQQVTIGVLNSTPDPTATLKFCRYLAARDKGLKEFERFGFDVVHGDVWDEHLEILVYSGAMLRPGLRETIQQFEKREGVTINTVFNGCGILVAQMKGGARPEAYLSCDVSFMENVQDRFGPSTLLTENDMVILVQKGNPKKIGGLRDLAREGIRLGVAHEENSALGALTARMLKAVDLYEAVSGNKVLDSATGDFLVNQIRTGSLDAVIVYRSNGMANPENLEKYLDIVEIGLPDAKAVQPIAIARQADHHYLVERFFERVRSQESRKRFESFGFRWSGAPPQ